MRREMDKVELRRSFEQWCTARGLASLPATPQTVAVYISDLPVTHKPATIGRHMAAIASAHKAHNYESPCSMRHGCVSAVWHGIRRTMGTAQTQKSPLLVPDLRKIADNLPDNLLGKRDRAVLLVGFAGAFRRSEIVGLDVEDVQFTSDGVVITLRRSKTDQTGAGRKVGLPYGSNPETPCALLAGLD
jgi:site-specific recombinase XerD